MSKAGALALCMTGGFSRQRAHWLRMTVLFGRALEFPVYQFDFPMMLVSLAAFILIYEMLMFVYSEKIKKISMKEIMTE